MREEQTYPIICSGVRAPEIGVLCEGGEGTVRPAAAAVLRDVLVQRLGHVRLAVLVGPGEGLRQILGAEIGPRWRGEKALPDDAGRVLLLASPHLGAMIRRCGRDNERLEGEHFLARRGPGLTGELTHCVTVAGTWIRRLTTA